MTPELIEDSTDDFGWRRIVFDLGDGVYQTFSVATPPPGKTHIDGEYVALPVEPGTASAPGFMLWVPLEGEPQFNWLGFTTVEDARDRWVGDLNRRQPELADALSRLFEVIVGDDDDEDAHTDA